MPGDYSRKTFDKTKHYSRVNKQQGRVELDADWNEEMDIEEHRTFTGTIDVIGTAGVPKKNDGFRISVSADGTDLVIKPGRIYLEGLLCELEPGSVKTYKNQPYYPDPDLSDFNTPGSPPGSPVGSPPAAKLKDGSYIVYLKAWQREINYMDDPYIQEKALGEADTTTRLQIVWQVRLLKVQDNGSGNCDATFPEWNALTAPLTGLLNAQTKKPDDNKDPCVLPPSAGYLRLENQLYRVQVQKVDSAKKALSFKWSRDNASIETIIEEVADKVLTVHDIGKDDVLGFAGNQWVEIVDEASMLSGNPYPLVQIDSINPDSRKITLKTSVSQFETRKGLKLRRWDMDGVMVTGDGLPVGPGWLDIEDGIQVMFSNGTFEPGDYWLIPGRTATGNIEWPQLAPGIPLDQPRVGTNYYYCRLAFVKVQNGVIGTPEDCRPLFPTLTEICAEDICYNNKNCVGSTAKTVQEALDELCRKREGPCTYMALPGPGWENVFNKIGDLKDAQVCFQVGDYPLQNPVFIKNKGNLKLTGCGPGTRILSPKAEVALVFDQCKAISIRDVYAQSGTADSKNKNITEHLNGVFTFTNCESVNIDHVNVWSGISATRTATCITVNNNFNTPCPVRIEDCDLQIGYRQQGILLVNVTNCWVENNSLKSYESQQGAGIANAIKNKQVRAGIRNILVSNVSSKSITAGGTTNTVKDGIAKKVSGRVTNAIKGGITNVAITAGGISLFFKTDKSLKNEWQKVLAANPPVGIKNAKELQKHVMKLANRVISDDVFRAKFPKYMALFNVLNQERAFGSQGITIGGRVGKDVYVKDNVIINVLQGIHVGFSHETAQRQPDTSENLSISGNSIYVLLPRTVGKQDRYGIFVGNCKNLLVENNTIKLERINSDDNTAIEGIRAWGIFGNRVMVTKNLVCSIDGDRRKSFNTGIKVHPLKDNTGNDQWIIMWNVAPSKVSTVSVSNGAVAVAGTNTPV